MTKPIKLERSTWSSLLTELHKLYPKSVLAIRQRMRDKLGFTPRDHRYFDPRESRYIDVVFLDFYSENKRTMFLMKYSEFLSNDQRFKQSV